MGRHSRRFARGTLGVAAVAFWLITAGGRAWGQVPPATGLALQRAAALVRTRAFDRAAATLRGVLSVDPTNRGAQEMLAFALESKGDLEGGLHTLRWNGSTEIGSRAASGIYFFKLRSPDGDVAKSLVLMK